MPSRNAARAIAKASIGSDLPRVRDATTRAGHQLRRHTHHNLAAVNQKPLQAPGDVADVLDRPHPLAFQAAGPFQQLPVPHRPGRHGPVRDLLRLVGRPPRRYGSACADQLQSSPFVLSLQIVEPMKRTSWRTFLSRGAVTLLLGHARTSLTATGDNFTNRSGPQKGRRKQQRSARSRQGQSTTHAQGATPSQLDTEDAEVGQRGAAGLDFPAPRRDPGRDFDADGLAGFRVGAGLFRLGWGGWERSGRKPGVGLRIAVLQMVATCLTAGELLSWLGCLRRRSRRRVEMSGRCMGCRACACTWRSRAARASVARVRAGFRRQRRRAACRPFLRLARLAR